MEEHGRLLAVKGVAWPQTYWQQSDLKIHMLLCSDWNSLGGPEVLESTEDQHISGNDGFQVRSRQAI
jgi:hypothetical protein